MRRARRCRLLLALLLPRRRRRRTGGRASTSWARRPRRCRRTTPLNPGMLWVLDGEELWRQPAGASGRSCADCHGDARAEHARRRRALSRLRCRPAGADHARRAHPGLPPGPPGGSTARAREPRPAGACWRSSPTSRAACRSPSAMTSASARHRARARAVRAPPGPARSVLRPLPRRQPGPAAGRQRDPAGATRPATRSTAWNGRHWARCSGACATA